MYITDKKHRQIIISYIKFKHKLDLDMNRLYIFRYEYLDNIFPSYYTISAYKGYITEWYPHNLDANEVDMWGELILRKEKIDKIRNNGSKQTVV